MVVDYGSTTNDGQSAKSNKLAECQVSKSSPGRIVVYSFRGNIATTDGASYNIIVMTMVCHSRNTVVSIQLAFRSSRDLLISHEYLLKL